MTSQIPETHRDLFTKPLVATLITITPDSKPHGTVVWCRLNGSHIQVSITNESQKYKNIQINPDVSVVIVDTTDPYRYIEVRGTATTSPENATEIVKDIARKYGRPDFDATRAQDRRVIVTISPTKILPHG